MTTTLSMWDLVCIVCNQSFELDEEEEEEESSSQVGGSDESDKEENRKVFETFCSLLNLKPRIQGPLNSSSKCPFVLPFCAKCRVTVRSLSILQEQLDCIKKEIQRTLSTITTTITETQQEDEDKESEEESENKEELQLQESSDHIQVDGNEGKLRYKSESILDQLEDESEEKVFQDGESPMSFVSKSEIKNIRKNICSRFSSPPTKTSSTPQKPTVQSPPKSGEELNYMMDIDDNDNDNDNDGDNDAAPCSQASSSGSNEVTQTDDPEESKSGEHSQITYVLAEENMDDNFSWELDPLEEEEGAEQSIQEKEQEEEVENENANKSTTTTSSTTTTTTANTTTATEKPKRGKRKRLNKDETGAIKEKIPKPKTFECEYCPESSFVNASMLGRHKKEKHADKLPIVVCPLCQKSYSNDRILQSHLRLHGKERNVVCPYPNCGLRFHFQSGLKFHLRFHSGQKRFKCQTCEKKFAIKGDLKEHQLSHVVKDPKPWKCHHCPSEFSWKKGMIEHIGRYHPEDGNVQKFKCTFEGCGREFMTKTNWKKHEAAIHSPGPKKVQRAPKAKDKDKDNVKAKAKVKTNRKSTSSSEIVKEEVTESLQDISQLNDSPQDLTTSKNNKTNKSKASDNQDEPQQKIIKINNNNTNAPSKNAVSETVVQVEEEKDKEEKSAPSQQEQKQQE